MANRRSFKKILKSEITYFIDSCYEILMHRPERQDEIQGLVDRAVEVYDELVEQVNHPDAETAQRAFFQDLRKRLLTEVQALREQLTHGKAAS